MSQIARGCRAITSISLAQKIIRTVIVTLSQIKLHRIRQQGNQILLVIG